MQACYTKQTRFIVPGTRFLLQRAVIQALRLHERGILNPESPGPGCLVTAGRRSNWLEMAPTIDRTHLTQPRAVNCESTMLSRKRPAEAGSPDICLPAFVTDFTSPVSRVIGSWSGKTKLTHAHCRNSARGDCETLIQRGIDLCKERREGAQ
jgi:hypothetical protein